jgi:hypothetical protein
MKTVAIPLFVAVSLLAAADPALACSCAGFLTFEQALAAAPIVVVGRVSSIGSFRSPRRGGTDPPVVEIDIASVNKGLLETKRVDVWNQSAGSSCGGGLRALDVGSNVVLALRYARAADVAPAAVLRRTGVRDPGERVLILAPGACGESRRVVRSQRELDRWIVRRIR